MPEQPRRAWRYRITASSGCMAEQAPPRSHMLEWRYLGDEYTWHVYDFKPASPTFGECVGWATGEYVDRGVIDEHGRYEAAT